MKPVEYLERSLMQIAQGDLRFKQVLIPFLANSLLVVPILDQVDSGDTSKLKLRLFFDSGRKVLPVFSTKRLLNIWGGENIPSITLHGADLAMVLDDNLFISINPCTPSETELIPSDLRELRDNIVSLKEASKSFHSLVETQGSRPTGSSVRMNLVKILSDFEEIKEAYFQEVKRIDERDGLLTEAVLGLLVGPIAAEKRFELVSAVAALSRSVFGEAGAIEVYDDLHYEQSSSWELFSAMAPIYVRDEYNEEPPEISISGPAQRFSGTVQVTVEQPERAPLKKPKRKKFGFTSTMVDRLRKIGKEIIAPGW